MMAAFRGSTAIAVVAAVVVGSKERRGTAAVGRRRGHPAGSDNTSSPGMGNHSQEWNRRRSWHHWCYWWVQLGWNWDKREWSGLRHYTIAGLWLGRYSRHSPAASDTGSASGPLETG